jgi:hypothetical protein
MHYLFLKRTLHFRNGYFSYPQVKKWGDAHSFGSERKNSSYGLDIFCLLPISECALRIVLHWWERNGKCSVEVVKYGKLTCNVGQLHLVSECLTHVM